MWSWTKQKFHRGVGFFTNPIKRKLSRDWEILDVDRFYNFIENLGLYSVMLFYMSLFVGAIGGVL